MSRSAYVVQKTEDIGKFYTMGKQLGMPGQFGCARLAIHKASGEKRAVKIISKARFVRSTDRDFHFAQLRAEIEVMKNLNHPNVIKFYEVFEDETELCIVMECCSGGELFDRIKDSGTYSEHDASIALRQIFDGIAHMHAKRIAHVLSLPYLLPASLMCAVATYSTYFSLRCVSLLFNLLAPLVCTLPTFARM